MGKKNRNWVNREVFLSYAREDADMAQQIADALNDEGYQVWWDQEVNAGVEWPEELDRRLSSAVAIVVVWSADSVESDYVLAEARTGYDRKVLVAVVVEECSIPPPFDLIHWIDLSDWQGGRGYGPFRQLVSSIEKYFESEHKLDHIQERIVDLEDLYDEADPNELLDQAEAGDPDAQFRLGIAHMHGIGDFDEDPHEAERWLTRAARQDFEPAFGTLGGLYQGGFLGEVDTPKALKWFKRAAKAGDAAAAWQLSQIYTHGAEGVRANPNLARRYCELAADLGDEEAIELLSES